MIETRPLLGHTVTLPDGRSGPVVCEYREWQDEHGVHHGHRLRVAVTLPTCGQCPHGLVTHYETVDAESVSIASR